MRLSLPSPEVAPGGQVYIDSSWAADKRKDGFRVIAALVDGTGKVLHSGLAVPGFDWYAVKDWKKDERVAGCFRIDLPEAIPQGNYELVLVLMDEKSGEVLARQGEAAAPPAEAGAEEAAAATPAPAAPASFVAGEFKTGLSVAIVSWKEAHDQADRDHEAGQAAAAEGRCAEAWQLWKDAIRHIARDEDWRARTEGPMRSSVAGCYVILAQQAAERGAQIEALTSARFWDHRHEGMRALAEPLAARLEEEGDSAMQSQAWAEAYTLYSQALKLDPSRAWARRKAEDARDLRLNITRPGQKRAAPAAEEADEPAAGDGDGN
jgi:tetratricopeptide (TPR) repeat protein